MGRNGGCSAGRCVARGVVPGQTMGQADVAKRISVPDLARLAEARAPRSLVIVRSTRVRVRVRYSGLPRARARALGAVRRRRCKCCENSGT